MKGDFTMKRFTVLLSFLTIAVSELALSQRYILPITVTDGINTKVLHVGMWPGATDGYDAGLDTLAPPAPPAGAFDARLRVVTPPNDFFTDLRSNTITPRTHTMLYAPATGAGPIVLSWRQASLDSLDPLGTFFIHDNFGGGLFSLDMKTTGTLNTNSSPFLASSLTIVITPVQPVPIQLASFTGRVTTSGAVLLEWMTISEINNYGFEVQRHGEGEPFVSLPGVFIPGHGTTIEPHHYSYTDATVVPGPWWYRLKQIDLDGSVSYSPEVTVNTLTNVGSGERPAKFSLDQNYPNPFNPTTTIKYSTGNSGRVVLRLYDVYGQQVATLVDQVQGPGDHSVDLDAHHLASGVYYYSLDAGTWGAMKKLVLLK